MRVLYLLLILVVVGTGCEKYNLKQPAYLSLNWKFNSTTSSQGNARIEKGFFYSKEFTVNGTRVKGSPVSITQSLPVQKVEFTTQNDLGISLDIPMGDYTEFTIKTIIDKANNPCLKLEGTFYKGQEPIPMVIEWKQLDELSFKILNPFSLEKKKDYKVYIGFDAEKLFENISNTKWSQVGYTNENGVTTLVINDGNNIQLFNTITEQLPNALVLTVE
ncbi:hypothetical protein [Fluviicola taffensis]|uniref:Lipoprotein n=1 Tax=Fluviicola taffensis (strain DSM 16823 / NCIMB 13979 / RW262) TaxID=755732 RepID=F2I9A8_FLUTR|nr:hypothetical protein [Fluviicola taffensis]AEA44065.1 hypothetical protein Fluta_2079 [Fluviicola taffensis DSM 16823]